jgi:uncharacterized protein YciI
MFHVLVTRSGPSWRPERPLEEQSGWSDHAAFMDALAEEGFIVLGGPLGDERRVVHAVEAASEAAIRETLARDPWSETHLQIEAIDEWTIRLDGREHRDGGPDGGT